MDRKTLLHFSGQLRHTLEIPVRVFEQDEMIACHELSEANPLINLAITAFSQAHARQHGGEHAFLIDFSGSFILGGMVVCAGTACRLMLGPVRTEVMNDNYVYDMLNSISFTQENLAAQVYQYLKMQPVMNRAAFLRVVNLVNTAVNGDSADWLPLSETEGQGAEEKEPAPIWSVSHLAAEPESKYEWENRRKILYLIRHGRVEELKKTLSGKIWKTGDDRVYMSKTMRSYQDHILMALETVCQNAISAGMDINMAYHIKEQYMERIELARSFDELDGIHSRMMMEYAECVRRMSLPETLSPMMRRVVSYTTEHIEERISASEVAEHFHISVPYLSSQFKKEMGILFVDYVNCQKIELAKQYLRFSELSLSGISNQLSFASQGYFQKVFKDITGKTPGAYRSEKGVF